MRIDAHQHFWKYDPNRDTWIDNSMLVLQNDFLPKDLQPILTQNKFDGCIVVQADQSVDETQFLLQLSDDSSFIKGIVGWVDLMNQDIEQTLSKLSNHKKFKGVRHILQAEPEGFMLQDEFLNGISLLEKFNLTYDVLISPHQLEEAIKLVETFPKQKFVLDHLAKPEIKANKITTWKEDIFSLSSFQNVYCKLSGLVTEADWNSWKPEDFTAYLDVVFKAFGVERLMFGSDWPVCLLASNYAQVVKLIENYMTPLSQKEQEDIMGKNTMKFYNIN
ncbi:MAG TPA: amidohydrolase family protein [Flavobacteriaceae bacterium]|nr:amidohydrolase family protein [Flavobacteriaceae bacterium]